MGAVDFAVSRVVDGSTDNLIEAEVQGLREQMLVLSRSDFIELVEQRSQDQDVRGAVYLMVDPQLRPVAGNVPAWPKLEAAEGKKIWIEEVHAHCLAALQTETQVMVKREDEQAFAELNGAYLKFVEDAARLLYKEFDSDRRITDFRIACSHLESLHSHDAVSVICKGVKGGFTADFMDFDSLLC